jgi:Cu/Ag efflux protein CusF
MQLKSNQSVRAVVLALLPVCCCVGASYGAQDEKIVMEQAEPTQAPKLFHGVGIITAVDAKSGLIRLDHEAIPGLMDAMEMEYEAKPARLAEGLAVGDKIDFTVDGRTLAVLDVKKLFPAK